MGTKSAFSSQYISHAACNWRTFDKQPTAVARPFERLTADKVIDARTTITEMVTSNSIRVMADIPYRGFIVATIAESKGCVNGQNSSCALHDSRLFLRFARTSVMLVQTGKACVCDHVDVVVVVIHTGRPVYFEFHQH